MSMGIPAAGLLTTESGVGTVAAADIAAGGTGMATSGSSLGTTAAVTEGSNVGTSSAVADYLGGSSLSEGLSPIQAAMDVQMALRQMDRAEYEFDLMFDENKRRWGLEFALKEWSLRKNMDIQKARELYNRALQGGQFNIQRAQAATASRQSALQQLTNERNDRWAKDDRNKRLKMGQAYSKGLVLGLTGRS